MSSAHAVVTAARELHNATLQCEAKQRKPAPAPASAPGPAASLGTPTGTTAIPDYVLTAKLEIHVTCEYYFLTAKYSTPSKNTYIVFFIFVFYNIILGKQATGHLMAIRHCYLHRGIFIALSTFKDSFHLSFITARFNFRGRTISDQLFHEIQKLWQTNSQIPINARHRATEFEIRTP